MTTLNNLWNVHIYMNKSGYRGKIRELSPLSLFRGERPPEFCPHPEQFRGGNVKKSPRWLRGGKILFYCQIILKIPYFRLYITKKIKVVQESAPPEQNLVFAPDYTFVLRFYIVKRIFFLKNAWR